MQKVVRKMVDDNQIIPIENQEMSEAINGMTYTKNFRSATAEEWYIFVPGFKDPFSGGAAGKVIIHYNLFGNKDVFINTTVILDDPELHKEIYHKLVYGLAEEIVNRLVGYADTLLSVHSGMNSYQAEYKS
jgi:glycosyltransferase involved in cell wall biosynthesis